MFLILTQVFFLNADLTAIFGDFVFKFDALVSLNHLKLYCCSVIFKLSNISVVVLYCFFVSVLVTSCLMYVHMV